MSIRKRAQKAAPMLLLFVAPLFAHASSFLTRSAHVSGPRQTFSHRVTVTNFWDSPYLLEEYACVPASWNCEYEALQWPFAVDFGPVPAEVGVDAPARAGEAASRMTAPYGQLAWNVRREYSV